MARNNGRGPGKALQDFDLPTQSGTPRDRVGFSAHSGVRKAGPTNANLQDGFTLTKGSGPKRAPDFGSPRVRAAGQPNMDQNLSVNTDQQNVKIQPGNGDVDGDGY